MTGPLEHYPVDPASVDEAGQELNAAANPLFDITYEAATGTRRAGEHVNGDLLALLVPMHRDLILKGSSLRTASAFAGGIVRAWAVAITVFNAEVDALNEEYAQARATGFGVAGPDLHVGMSSQERDSAIERHDDRVQEAGDALLAELQRRRTELLEQLRETGDDLASRLERGPQDEDWVAFEQLGVLPHAFRDHLPDPGPRPEVPEEDAWYETAFKTLVFDWDQFGEGGSFWGGAIEIAGIIPVGKILKGGKLIDAAADGASGTRRIDNVQDARDAQRAYDQARAAERAAADAQRDLLRKFDGGARPSASDLSRYAEDQGWTRTGRPNGPPTYVDENGIERLTIKKASENPHAGEWSRRDRVEMRDASGQRIGADGEPVTKKSEGNHTPIEWDLD